METIELETFNRFIPKDCSFNEYKQWITTYLPIPKGISLTQAFNDYLHYNRLLKTRKWN